jgi:hypothetical protein
MAFSFPYYNRYNRNRLGSLSQWDYIYASRPGPLIFGWKELLVLDLQKQKLERKSLAYIKKTF